MREALADESAERRVVAGAAADDDRDLPVGDAGGSHDAAGDAADGARVGRDEAVDHLVREVLGSIVETCHPAPPDRAGVAPGSGQLTSIVSNRLTTCKLGAQTGDARPPAIRLLG
ncbi:hypothetical protein GCM10025870_15780 [Agromyces marinus]|uniref:Uncharacterized protein n=1 Tax=Agromyces marinus TaxID=1389020 RepID=A0ABM8H194_9MICO|nr:hypothetical protein GCM10025870_15780 [Agromyces marinus]